MNTKDIVDQLPLGLERKVARILSFHIGREKAITRDELIKEIERAGINVHERQVRAAIWKLRREEGLLICSAASKDGGYFMAADWQEYRDFKIQEFISKIVDMQETVNAMDKTAEKTFGRQSTMQMGLGI